MEAYIGETYDIRHLSDVKRFNEYCSGKNFMPYTQVFSQKLGFIEHLSILDLLFNEGKHVSEYLIASHLPE